MNKCHDEVLAADLLVRLTSTMLRIETKHYFQSIQHLNPKKAL